MTKPLRIHKCWLLKLPTSLTYMNFDSILQLDYVKKSYILTELSILNKFHTHKLSYTYWFSCYEQIYQGFDQIKYWAQNNSWPMFISTQLWNLSMLLASDQAYTSATINTKHPFSSLFQTKSHTNTSNSLTTLSNNLY